MPLSAKAKVDLESFTRLTLNTLEGDKNAVLGALRAILSPDDSYSFSLAGFLEVENILKLLRAPYKVVGAPVHNSFGIMTRRALLSPEDHQEAVNLIKKEIADGIKRIESGETLVEAGEKIAEEIYKQQEPTEEKVEEVHAQAQNGGNRQPVLLHMAVPLENLALIFFPQYAVDSTAPQAPDIPVPTPPTSPARPAPR